MLIITTRDGVEIIVKIWNATAAEIRNAYESEGGERDEATWPQRGWRYENALAVCNLAADLPPSLTLREIVDALRERYPEAKSFEDLVDARQKETKQ